MEENKGCLPYLRIVLGLVVLAIAWPFAESATAVTAPDNFREKVIDVTAHCYPVFDRLSVVYWSDRDAYEVLELREDARKKRDYALDMLKRYSAIYSNFNLNEIIDRSGGEMGVKSASNESLLDMAIYCEKELYTLVDEESEKGYTP